MSNRRSTLRAKPKGSARVAPSRPLLNRPLKVLLILLLPGIILLTGTLLLSQAQQPAQEVGLTLPANNDLLARLDLATQTTSPAEQVESGSVAIPTAAPPLNAAPAVDPTLPVNNSDAPETLDLAAQTAAPPAEQVEPGSAVAAADASPVGMELEQIIAGDMSADVNDPLEQFEREEAEFRALNAELHRYTVDPLEQLTKLNGGNTSYRPDLTPSGVPKLPIAQAAYHPPTIGDNRPMGQAVNTVQYRYNGNGQLVGKTENGVRTDFALDIAGELPEVIQTSDGTTYLHLPGVTVVENAAGERRYLLPDGLGNIRQVMSGTTVVAQRDYDPYGNPIPPSQPLAPAPQPPTSYGFTGEWWEQNAQLLHLRDRWYLPESGVFLSKDRWAGNPLRSQSLNGWSYVEGNPVNRVDPFGRCWGPARFLRQTPYYDVTCNNLDMAILIAGHPQASAYEKAQAISYVEWAAISHLVLAEAFVIGGHSWLIETSLAGGETYDRLNPCSDPAPGEKPSPPSTTHPIPDTLPPIFPPDKGGVEGPNNEDPFNLPEYSPPGGPPQYPEKDTLPGNEADCQQLRSLYHIVQSEINKLEKELKEAQDEKAPDHLMEGYYEASLKKMMVLRFTIQLEYRARKCEAIIGPLELE